MAAAPGDRRGRRRLHHVAEPGEMAAGSVERIYPRLLNRLRQRGVLQGRHRRRQVALEQRHGPPPCCTAVRA